MYGATDILIAEVQLQRLYPGGPARARFIAEAFRQFCVLTERLPGVPVVMIAGNHDSGSRIELPAPLMRRLRTHAPDPPHGPHQP